MIGMKKLIRTEYPNSLMIKNITYNDLFDKSFIKNTVFSSKKYHKSENICISA